MRNGRQAVGIGSRCTMDAFAQFASDGSDITRLPVIKNRKGLTSSL
jgi:hypothetical protein